MLNDELFSLVKSLDVSEKRYFKRFAQFHVERDKNRYIQLFEWMDAQAAYNEKSIKARFRQAGQDTFAANLSFNKRYLYGLLLKCLRNYHARRSARIRLNEQMIDIAILMEKGLLESAQTLLRKARRHARDYNLNLLELDLAAQERKIVRQFATRDAAEELEKIAESSRGALEQLRKEFALLRLYEKAFLMVRNKNFTADQAPELSDEIQLAVGNQPDEAPFTFDSAAYFHLLKSLAHRLGRQPEAANQHLRLLVEHFEQYPILLRETDYQERYLNALNNYFINCHALGQAEECQAVMEKMAAIEPSNLKMAAAVFHHTHYSRMLFHFQQKNYTAVIEAAPALKKGLAIHGANIPKNRELVFRYNLAVACYFERRLDQSLDWINDIVNDDRQEMRQDIQLLARIFHLAIHLERGHEVLVGNLLPAVRRFVRKNHRPESPEFRIVEALHQIVKTGRRDAVKTLRTQLEPEKGWEEFKEWARRQ